MLLQEDIYSDHSYPVAAARQPERISLFHHVFLEHPHEAGETYFQHLAFTLKFGGQIAYTALALIFHGLVPSCHQTTASERIFRLHALFKARWEKAHGEGAE